LPKFVRLTKYSTKININRALKTISHIFLTIAILVLAQGALAAQDKSSKMVASGKNAERIVTSENLEAQVMYLCDTTFGGRGTATRGSVEAAFWIARRMETAGMMPLSGSWGQSFQVGEEVGHNIVGFMPGTRTGKSESYIIVAAHYDSHGKMNGKVFPCADSNASGVVAMLTIADMFKEMKDLGRLYGCNVIFIASDGKERNSAGTKAFMDLLNSGKIKDPVSQKTIEHKQIKSAVVLDILGSSLEPMHRNRKDYLILLSNSGDKFYLSGMNSSQGINLDLGFDYYGSKNFTEMFLYRVGDQKVFHDNGIPVSLFTSGITMKTNKEIDDPESLDYEVFRKRVILIFHWLTKVL